MDKGVQLAMVAVFWDVWGIILERPTAQYQGSDGIGGAVGTWTRMDVVFEWLYCFSGTTCLTTPCVLRARMRLDHKPERL